MDQIVAELDLSQRCIATHEHRAVPVVLECVATCVLPTHVFPGISRFSTSTHDCSAIFSTLLVHLPSLCVPNTPQSISCSLEYVSKGMTYVNSGPVALYFKP